MQSQAHQRHAPYKFKVGEKVWLQAKQIRARPAHALSHETPAKKINMIFCYLARQRDRPVHFAAVARENITRDNPAKNKNGSRAVFFVAALGKIFLM